MSFLAIDRMAHKKSGIFILNPFIHSLIHCLFVFSSVLVEIWNGHKSFANCDNIAHQRCQIYIDDWIAAVTNTKAHLNVKPECFRIGRKKSPHVFTFNAEMTLCFCLIGRFRLTFTVMLVHPTFIQFFFPKASHGNINR